VDDVVERARAAEETCRLLNRVAMAGCRYQIEDIHLGPRRAVVDVDLWAEVELGNGNGFVPERYGASIRFHFRRAASSCGVHFRDFRRDLTRCRRFLKKAVWSSDGVTVVTKEQIRPWEA
jgi:hypothetical protein